MSIIEFFANQNPTAQAVASMQVAYERAINREPTTSGSLPPTVPNPVSDLCTPVPITKTRNPRGPQHANWVFTLFRSSYRGDDECLDAVRRIGQDATYCVVGLEICPSTGREHLQGFVVFPTVKRRETLSRAYGSNIHFEKMSPNATIRDNFKYVTKEYIKYNPSGYTTSSGKVYNPGTRQGDVLIFGEEPPHIDGPGEMERNRWKRAREQIVNCNGDFDRIEDDQIFVVHFKTVQSISNHYCTLHTPENLPETCGIWIWGPAGTGKSHFARTLVSATELFPKQLDKWWNGWMIQRHTTALIEDIDPSTPREMARLIKMWTDIYPFPGDSKCVGGAVLRPKQLIFTSNYTLQEVFPYMEDLQAFARRFRVFYLPDLYDPLLKVPSRHFEFNRVSLTRSEMERDSGVMVDLPMFNAPPARPDVPVTVQATGTVDSELVCTPHPSPTSYVTPVPLRKRIVPKIVLRRSTAVVPVEDFQASPTLPLGEVNSEGEEE